MSTGICSGSRYVPTPDGRRNFRSVFGLKLGLYAKSSHPRKIALYNRSPFRFRYPAKLHGPHESKVKIWLGYKHTHQGVREKLAVNQNDRHSFSQSCAYPYSVLSASGIYFLVGEETYPQILFYMKAVQSCTHDTTRHFRRSDICVLIAILLSIEGEPSGKVIERGGTFRLIFSIA